MKDSSLQEIKDRLNIADVIAGYIQVKKAGTNFRAVCPFHHEKTPSLMISPQKQIWHCFGCGEGGDVFGFVMRYENLDFKEALKILADKAGVKLPEYRPQDKGLEDEKDLLLKINSFAARFYHQILLRDRRGKEAMAYLKDRGLSLATIEKWQIGFAPDEFHALEKALTDKSVSVPDMVKAGVSAKNERGQVYDRFRGRITFPIFDYFGNVVGFSARILKQDSSEKWQSAKYVNSPETVIYNKSSLLFGLNFAKNSIRKTGEAVVVEGQMDCISAHQAGFENVVASSGTALTHQQLGLLGRLTKHLKFCFDADEAGLKATRKAIDLYLGQDFTIKIISLPDAKDPDELIRKDAKVFESRVREAKLFFDFYIEKAFENYAESSVEQKKSVAKDLLPLLAYLTDPLEQDHYVRLLSAKFGTTEQVIRDSLKKAVRQMSGQNGPAGTAKAAGTGGVPSGVPSTLEKEVLGGMLAFKDYLEQVAKEGDIEDFENYEIRELARSLLEGRLKRGDGDGLLPAVAKEALFMVESQMEEASGSDQIIRKNLLKSFFQLRLSGIKRQQKILGAEIKRVEAMGEKQALDDLNKKFAKASALRLHYEKQAM